MDTQAMEIIERISQDMRQAVKNKELIKVNELRSLLARISSAEAVNTEEHDPIAGAPEGVGSTEIPRKRLTRPEVRSIVLAEINEIEAALDILDTSSMYAAELREKIAVIQKYT